MTNLAIFAINLLSQLEQAMSRKLPALFWSDVPEQFMRASLRDLVDSYQAAAKAAEKYDEPEAHDLISDLRRAEFEGRWRRLAAMFPEAGAIAKPNRIKSAHHTYIRFGRVALTQSAVKTPEELVRRARFRETYAESGQQDLFITPAPPPADAPLYALFLHGPRDTKAMVPSFVSVVFPARDCDTYLSPISLGRMLHEELMSRSSIREEIVKDELNLAFASNSLSTKKRTEEGS